MMWKRMSASPLLAEKVTAFLVVLLAFFIPSRQGALSGNVNRAIRTARGKQALALAACVVAGLLLAAGTFVLQQRLGHDRAPPQTDDRNRLVQKPPPQQQPGAHPVAAIERHVTVTFPENKPAIATQLETEDPSVTIFLVYPVYTPASANNL